MYCYWRRIGIPSRVEASMVDGESSLDGTCD